MDKKPTQLHKLIAKAGAAKLQRDAAIQTTVFVPDLPVPNTIRKSIAKKQHEGTDMKVKLDEAKKRINEDKDKWKQSKDSKKL